MPISKLPSSEDNDSLPASGKPKKSRPKTPKDRISIKVPRYVIEGLAELVGEPSDENPLRIIRSAYAVLVYMKGTKE